MNPASTINLGLSPAFDRARKISRVMGVIFTIAFLVWLFVLIASLVSVIIQRPHAGVGLVAGKIIVPLGNLRGWRAAGAMAGVALFVVPIVMTLHHARKLFGRFARGEVFAVKPIAHIRGAGLWLTASFFTDSAGLFVLSYSGVATPVSPVAFLGTLFTGIATIVAAYVMEEARRIAVDHAEIV
jgi:hypothetical protein